MKILVTGSTGFVGKHLVPELLDQGHAILEITIDEKISKNLYGDKTQKHLVTDDQEALCDAIENFNPEAVIHLASFLTSNDDYPTLTKLLDTNINFFCRILDALKKTTIKLVINTGTFAEYYKGDNRFDPAYLYAATKTASRSFLDYYSKVYKFKQATVVPYTIYGGEDSQKKILDLIYDSISVSSPLALSPGKQVLDFIHINDVVDCYVNIIENIDALDAKSNFNLGTGKGHTLKELAKIIENISAKKTNINWGGKEYRPSDVMYAVADNKSLTETLNWKAKITLEEGIRTFIKKKESI